MELSTTSNSTDQETTETNAGGSCYMSATYDPSDDKIRLSAVSRLSPEEYKRAKLAGFRWAPMQKVFYTVWNPRAEDLAIEWCGSIEDSNQTLVDRAGDRAERFEQYSDNRSKDAERARAAVEAIAGNIPLGQPILVGHHSERHARRDAEKIENGMRKAVNMWKTSEYWKQRAAGALAHAEYKELPGVRARRIKTLEAAKRQQIASYTPRDNRVVMQQDWRSGKSDGPAIPHVLVGPPGRGGHLMPVKHLEGIKAGCQRYIEHLTFRIEYERALLDEAGATSLLARKPKSGPALLPLCNYQAPDGLRIENRYHRGEFMQLPQKSMTQAEYAAIWADYKGTRVVDNSHRVRSAMINHSLVVVFLTDSKVHKRPDPLPEPERAPRPFRDHVPQQPKPADPEREQFQAMEQTLKAGVQVVSANQLFPTPADVAARMVEIADIGPGMDILEPSAGTGAILNECFHLNGTGFDGTPAAGRTVAVEINWNLAERLRHEYREAEVRHMDFLDFAEERLYDRILMNPPFENGADIKHIQHAMKFLKPGGRLVAICANGPRQQDKLQPIADRWEVLPAGTFAGTNVNAAIIEISNG